ncbi:MAG TPA: alkaline phosphatase [Gammaproteobacteria bacterium]
MIVALLACQGCVSTGGAPSGAAPKVVLIIGDGMDDQQITIARHYLVGEAGALALDGMPQRAAVRMQTVAEEDPSLPDYVPDSANTATSMAAGIVTSAGRIATTAGTDRDVVTIMELAADAGFGTGIVTTASVTDATPASFVAHVNWRLCEGPRSMVPRSQGNGLFTTNCSADLKANGGQGSISEQIAASRVDVVLGGGFQHFDQPAEGETTKTVADLAADNGFTVVRTGPELAALPDSGRVLGLFSPSTMPVQWRGAGDAQAERVQRVEGRPMLPEPFSCEPNPEFAAMPTLPAMASAALERLDGKAFVLMIESASIDKQSHLRRPCGQIGELGQLDDTLKVVLDYARAHPETLVLVTADHSQAAQLVPETSVLAALNAASPGYFARVRTPEGGVMGVSYATNDSNIQEDHTGADVPLFASGPGADEIPSSLRQPEIFGVMLRHLGLSAPR